MSDNFVTALKAEITELEAELRADPRHRKLARLRETLSEYEPGKEVIQPVPASKAETPAQISMIDLLRAKIAVRSTKEDRIKTVLMTIFRKNGAQHRTVLLEYLTKLDLMGHEKNPMQALAIFLSGHKDIFEYDGKGNWDLRKPVAQAIAAE